MKLLTTQEAAARLGIGVEQFRRYVRAGRIVRAQTTPGGHGRFDAEVIEAMAKGRPNPSETTAV